MGLIYQPQIAGSGGAPSGPAGGDLAGTYPNPTLGAAGPGATGPVGDYATHVPVVTIDAKGRVTALSSTPISGGGGFSPGGTLAQGSQLVGTSGGLGGGAGNIIANGTVDIALNAGDIVRVFYNQLPISAAVVNGTVSLTLLSP